MKKEFLIDFPHIDFAFSKVIYEFAWISRFALAGRGTFIAFDKLLQSGDSIDVAATIITTIVSCAALEVVRRKIVNNAINRNFKVDSQWVRSRY